MTKYSPVECPTCGSPVPEAARFCPVCERPRRAVEQQLLHAAETTGTPYETLLERALDDNERNPQPFTPPAVDDPVQHNEPPPSTRAWWKPITAVFIAVVVIVAIGSVGDDDSADSNERRSVTSGSSRPTATRSQQSSTSSTMSDSAYTSALFTITDDMGSSLVRFSRLAENPRIGEGSWNGLVAVEFVTWDTNYRKLQDLSPPPRFAAAHSKTLQSMRELTSAADDISAGIDTNNADRIKQGTAKIERAGQLMEEAVDLMP